MHCLGNHHQGQSNRHRTPKMEIVGPGTRKLRTIGQFLRRTYKFISYLKDSCLRMTPSLPVGRNTTIGLTEIKQNIALANHSKRANHYGEASSRGGALCAGKQVEANNSCYYFNGGLAYRICSIIAQPRISAQSVRWKKLISAHLPLPFLPKEKSKVHPQEYQEENWLSFLFWFMISKFIVSVW